VGWDSGVMCRRVFVGVALLVLRPRARTAEAGLILRIAGNFLYYLIFADSRDSVPLFID
jgi:hypothetical protein